MCRSTPFRSIRIVFWGLFLTALLLEGEMSRGYAAFHPLSETVETLDEVVRQGMEAWEIPGVAYAVVSGDKVVHQGCFGFRKKGETGPEWLVDENTIFQIGSTTKAFTATLTAMLVDEGRFAWNDRVEDYLPGFRLKDRFAQKDFRLFDLMAQHSGLSEHSLDGMAVLGYGRNAIMKALRFVEPESPFRSEFAYQNCLYLTAAAVIERETGLSWEENLKERIFDPLGMESAGSTFGEFTADPARMAWLHRLGKGGTEVLPLSWPWQDWPYHMGPAAAIHLDIEDFALWLKVQIGGESPEGMPFLSEEERDFLVEPRTLIHLGHGDGAAYCQGWLRESCSGSDLVWHNGSTLGAHSVIAFLPDKQAGMVVLTNQNGNCLPEALMRTFVDLWSGRPGKDWVSELSVSEGEGAVRRGYASPHRQLTAYEGTYKSPVYGEIRIVEDRGVLSAAFRTPKPQVLKLEPWDGDTFAAEWDVFPDPRIFVVFHPGPSRGMEAVTVEPLDDETGTGRFERVP